MMEMIIFTGIPASGKSSLYKELFFKSHIRISLDLLNTRNKENKLLRYCFETQSKMVIDNTNITVESRKKYIESAKQNQYEIIGYFFESSIQDCLERNRNRKDAINEIGIKAKYKDLEKPGFKEGFDKIFNVRIVNNTFKISPYEN
ncbi:MULTISPECIES: AAA family ATPase [Chryseobacterium]|uniref:Kinase n=1 Tax=Chryseobacterium camelliae TaxID=1265445 RepID=A0ABU0TEA4_9FLAO|nr:MULTISPECIES: AAA family ATPase [Chryseobacterium]MDT3406811.1 putative kinase [Pseudacidovorax intermedius]MDQ1095394.1 putative kinase [Chryseobacterium camelliae]MDQ1099334.1 putative kinase [Chryseobacterium sp. SORGH_AS_1048]MDR6086680.1 putative kinase [Chryseobacterium sp. SORGH_AS_0909]MDR6131052.1 putative kinase [Chryseobacterium sp. SORGH_AS_1175]